MIRSYCELEKTIQCMRFLRYEKKVFLLHLYCMFSFIIILLSFGFSKANVFCMVYIVMFFEQLDKQQRRLAILFMYYNVVKQMMSHIYMIPPPLFSCF